VANVDADSKTVLIAYLTSGGGLVKSCPLALQKAGFGRRQLNDDVAEMHVVSDGDSPASYCICEDIAILMAY
jgi:hypothetical protein